jgi:hypothetical protein
MDDDEVIDRAQRWARLHANPKLRGRMDTLLEDASEEDQRRIRLLGQRIAAGMSIKLVPAATKEERSSEDGKESKPKRRRKAAAE